MTADGGMFGNGIQMKGENLGSRHHLTLLDNTGVPIAVCLSRFELIEKAFMIYTLRPLHAGQEKADHQYEGHDLYTFAEVKKFPFTKDLDVTITGDNGPSFLIRRTGLLPEKRTIYYHGKAAAVMDGGTWNGNNNTYYLTICPGVDPCLIVCLCAICDELDEKN